MRVGEHGEHRKSGGDPGQTGERPPEAAVRAADLRERVPGQTEQIEQVLVPVQLAKAQQERPRRVAGLDDVLAVSRNTSQASMVPRATSSGSAPRAMASSSSQRSFGAENIGS